MQKVMKNEVDIRYKEILRNLSVNWKLQSKNKFEELKRTGLNTSSVGIKSMYDLIEKLIYDSIESLDNMINQISRDFNTVIPFKELKKYIQAFEKAIYGHIDGMQEDIHDFFKDLPIASIEVRVNNIKGNGKSKLDRIYTKNKNLQKFKKIEWLVIFNTIVAILGLVVGIMSLVNDNSQVQYLSIIFNNM